MIYIKRLDWGSETYGPCEICKRKVDEVHIARSDGTNDIFFGHDNCLVKRFTKKRKTENGSTRST